jgi:hypothetical protein
VLTGDEIPAVVVEPVTYKFVLVGSAATPYATSSPIPPKYVSYSGVYCWVLLAGGVSFAAHTSKPPSCVP